jgi:hydrogenase maturation protease
VLGLGNPLRGDDGIGAAVIQSLQQRTLPAGVRLLDGGTPGLETVLLLQQCARAIIIDAADMQQAPGAYSVFTLDEVALKSGDLYQRVTVHYAGLAEALALGEAMGLLPREIVIVGVQPAAVGWEIGLSAPVQAAVEPVAQAVMALL